jgi:hypothetical protein
LRCFSLNGEPAPWTRTVAGMRPRADGHWPDGSMAPVHSLPLALWCAASVQQAG